LANKPPAWAYIRVALCSVGTDFDPLYSRKPLSAAADGRGWCSAAQNPRDFLHYAETANFFYAPPPPEVFSSSGFTLPNSFGAIGIRSGLTNLVLGSKDKRLAEGW